MKYKALLYVEQTYLLLINYSANNLIKAAYLYMETWKISPFKNIRNVFFLENFDFYIFLASGVGVSFTRPLRLFIRVVFIWVSKSNWFCVSFATRLA